MFRGENEAVIDFITSDTLSGTFFFGGTLNLRSVISSNKCHIFALSRVLFVFRGENEAVIDLITSDTLSGALSFLLFLSCVKSSIVHVS